MESRSSDINFSHLICPTGPLLPSLSSPGPQPPYDDHMITVSPSYDHLPVRWSPYDFHTMTVWPYHDKMTGGLAASPPPRPASGAQLASTSTGAASATAGSSTLIGRTSPSSSPIGCWLVEEEKEEALVVKGQSILHPGCRSLIFAAVQRKLSVSKNQQLYIEFHFTVRLDLMLLLLTQYFCVFWTHLFTRPFLWPGPVQMWNLK